MGETPSPVLGAEEGIKVPRASRRRLAVKSGTALVEYLTEAVIPGFGFGVVVARLYSIIQDSAWGQRVVINPSISETDGSTALAPSLSLQQLELGRRYREDFWRVASELIGEHYQKEYRLNPQPTGDETDSDIWWAKRQKSKDNGLGGYIGFSASDSVQQVFSVWNQYDDAGELQVSKVWPVRLAAAIYNINLRLIPNPPEHTNGMGEIPFARLEEVARMIYKLPPQLSKTEITVCYGMPMTDTIYRDRGIQATGTYPDGRQLLLQIHEGGSAQLTVAKNTPELIDTARWCSEPV